LRYFVEGDFMMLLLPDKLGSACASSDPIA
jgi:hypothetical protein